MMKKTTWIASTRIANTAAAIVGVLCALRIRNRLSPAKRSTRMMTVDQSRAA
jgi:hypothetical protein